MAADNINTDTKTLGVHKYIDTTEDRVIVRVYKEVINVSKSRLLIRKQRILNKLANLPSSVDTAGITNEEIKRIVEDFNNNQPPATIRRECQRELSKINNLLALFGD